MLVLRLILLSAFSNYSPLKDELKVVPDLLGSVTWPLSPLSILSYFRLYQITVKIDSTSFVSTRHLDLNGTEHLSMVLHRQIRNH